MRCDVVDPAADTGAAAEFGSYASSSRPGENLTTRAGSDARSP